jgi:hypothetical protein
VTPSLSQWTLLPQRQHPKSPKKCTNSSTT